MQPRWRSAEDIPENRQSAGQKPGGLEARTAMSIAERQRVTADDLLTMPDGERYELVDGQLVETGMSMESSWIAGMILRLIYLYLDSHPIGRVFPEGASYQCFPDDPNRVRKPDVSFIRMGRLSADQFQQGHCQIAPDLAVEVVSPNDLHEELMRKLEDYFAAGVPLVWVVEPDLRCVMVYEAPGRTSQRLRETEELTGGNVLPGFRCRVGDLFPVEEPAV
jgi:Uma2 family endonuclease